MPSLRAVGALVLCPDPFLVLGTHPPAPGALLLISAAAGNFLAIQGLGPYAFTAARGAVQSLVRELRSCKSRGMAKLQL